MSIMTHGATYAKDLERGKVYSANMGEVIKDENGDIWFFNNTNISLYNCPPFQSIKINPDLNALFYFLKDIC